jgi:hypothetical protein
MKTNSQLSKTRIIVSVFIALLITGTGFFLKARHQRPDAEKRNQYEVLLAALNKKAPVREKENGRKESAVDEPEMADYHDFLMTFDPATGTIPRERLVTAMKQTQNLAFLKQSSAIQWQGYPSDMGGRTRAIMYDPNDASHKKVWAAGVTGGLWFNNDITSAASPWFAVNDFWSNLAVRCLAYDPAHPQTFFLGTGEVETAMQTYRESSGLGTGIMRSDDGGQTWSIIAGTEQFAYVCDIVVRVENGVSVIYAGVASGLYKESQHQSAPSDGLFRSADNGVSWQQVLPVIAGSTVPYCVSDIALGADNRMYVGTRPNLNGEGAAVLLYSTNGLQWNVNSQYQTEIMGSSTANIPGRVVLATAPSDPNVVYALIASGFNNPVNGFNYFYCYHILRSQDKGVTWVMKNLPTDIGPSAANFATIAWHALDIAIDPNNPDELYIGGLDVHKSNNGGSSWDRVSDWSLMYYGGGPQYIHADQHIIVYKPGSSDEILFGTDGGVFYTSNGTSFSPAFDQRNMGYSTLQFYTCAIHPDAGTQQFYGGLQDNGSLFYNGNPLTIFDMVTGGDGAYCFYDELDPSLSITSLYYNKYSIFLYGNEINYTGNWSSGTFVSPADYDYKGKHLFANAVDYIGTNSDAIVRFDNLTTNLSGQFLSLGTGSTVLFTALKYSPYSPTGKSTLFVGSESGKLFKVNEAQTSSPVATDIGSAAFPTASISSIAIGKSEDTLMVTFSNYGVASVWQTVNGGQSWDNIEGNLPDMPVRWALYHPSNARLALLATETGVWECANLTQTPVVWQPVNTGMANVRVDMLQIRKADNTVLAATHGRGLFTMTWDIYDGVPEKKMTNLSVFPNPSNGQIHVSAVLDQPGTMSLSVTDLLGKQVYNETLTVSAGSFNRQINLENQPKGAYLVTMKNNNRILFSKKVIKN